MWTSLGFSSASWPYCPHREVGILLEIKKWMFDLETNVLRKRGEMLVLCPHSDAFGKSSLAPPIYKFPCSQLQRLYKQQLHLVLGRRISLGAHSTAIGLLKSLAESLK